MTKNTTIKKVALLLLSLFIGVLLLEIGLRAGRIILLFRQEFVNLRSLKGKGEYVVLCLGDAATSWGGRDSYPVQLEEVLNKRDTGISFTVINTGRAGIKTGGILKELENNLNKYNPEIVVALVGGNNLHELPELISFKEEEGSAWQRFFKNLKVYKLARLLGKRIIYQPGKLKQIRPAERIKGKPVPPPRQDNDSRPRKTENEISSAEKELIKGYRRRGESLRNQGRFKEAEVVYRESLKITPRDLTLWTILGDCYIARKRWEEARDLYRNAFKENPDKGWRAITLGNWYRAQNRYGEARKMYLEALTINPNDWRAWLEWGRQLQWQGQWEPAIYMYEKAWVMNPEEVRQHGDLPYGEIENWYRNHGKYAEAEAFYQKTVKYREYIDLSRSNRSQGKLEEAEKILGVAIDIMPDCYLAYNELEQLYQRQGKHIPAEEMSEKSMGIRARSYQTIFLLRIYREGKGIRGAAENLYRDILSKEREEIIKRSPTEADELGPEPAQSDFARNYQRIKRILNKKGIPLICVQYPLSKVEQLKRIFPDHEGVIFVDNEVLFRKAVKNMTYEDYFVDSFGGDFGHCTPKGNRLLAENVANAILDEVLGVREKESDEFK